MSAMRTALLALVVLATTTGCSTLCMFNCGTERHGSTPLVDYLYPSGDVPRQDAAVELPVPLRVGLTFVPGNQSLDAARREEILGRVRDRFSGLKYVSSITVVPDYYLSPRGGMDSLVQLARLHQFDVIALVSTDQMIHREENQRSLWYLTVVGAFWVHGSEHATHTLVDLAVVHPESRSLILRAGGVNSMTDSSSAIDQSTRVREQREQGLQQATDQLMTNFDNELKAFADRVRAGDAPVRVVRRDSVKSPGGGGGSIGMLMALFFSFLAMARIILAGRASRAQ